MTRRAYLAAALAAALTARWAAAAPEPTALADKADPPPAAPASVEVSDPAFNAYVDPALLGRAWSERDPALLTDAGLQLAEGERVLLRTHKSGVDAESLLGLAAKAAADKHDKATLDRLAKAAERLDRKALAGRVAAAQKLAGTARAADPALTISVEDVTPEDFARFQQILRDIQGARIAGDRKGLDDVENSLPSLKGRLPAAQVEALKKLASEARSSLPADEPAGEAKSEKLARALDRLASSSRGIGFQFQGVNSGFVVTPDTPSTFDDPPPPPPPPGPHFRIDNQGRVYESGTYFVNAQRFRLQNGRQGWLYDIPNGYHIWRDDNDPNTHWRKP